MSTLHYDYQEGTQKGKGAMSGRQNLEGDLGADLAPDDFLADIGHGRTNRVHGPKSQEKAFSLYVLVRRLRDCRLSVVRWLACGLARFIPESLLDRLGCQLHDGFIWESGPARDPGPGDTCAIGHQARRERDREIGFRVIEAALPIIILVGMMATAFSVLRIISHNKTAMAETKKEAVVSVPPVTDSSLAWRWK